MAILSLVGGEVAAAVRGSNAAIVEAGSLSDWLFLTRGHPFRRGPHACIIF